MKLKLLKYLPMLYIICAPLSNSHAKLNKINIGFGYFNLVGEGRNSSTGAVTQGTLSGLGAYQFSYKRNILPSLDVGLGYTALASKVYTGDINAGLNFMVAYFPFTLSQEEETQIDGQTLTFLEKWRPFVEVSYVQRNVQSTQTSYSGIGLAAGSEHTLGQQTSLLIKLDFTKMTGSRSTSLQTIEITGGLSYAF
jgi:hypothetical protein